jgi:hypothetical protein
MTKMHDGCVGHLHALFCHEGHHIVVAESVRQVPTNTGLDDFARKATTSVDDISINGLGHLGPRHKRSGFYKTTGNAPEPKNVSLTISPCLSLAAPILNTLSSSAAVETFTPWE